MHCTLATVESVWVWRKTCQIYICFPVEFVSSWLLPYLGVTKESHYVLLTDWQSFYVCCPFCRNQDSNLVPIIVKHLNLIKTLYAGTNKYKKKKKLNKLFFQSIFPLCSTLIRSSKSSINNVGLVRKLKKVFCVISVKILCHPGHGEASKSSVKQLDVKFSRRRFCSHPRGSFSSN